MAVPPPGSGSGAEEYGSEESSELVVAQTVGGEVVTADCAGGGGYGGGEPGDPQTGAPNPCSDDLFDPAGHKWYETYDWKFNADSTPSELTSSSAEDGMVEGMDSLVGLNNDCSLTGEIDAAHDYDGQTNNDTDVSQSGQCESFEDRDDASVVKFGDLPSSKLAVTCWYFFLQGTPDTAVEADVKFNKVEFEWNRSDGGSGCTDNWSVRGVMTHEAGHVFGLHHVNEQNHGNLTMSPKLNGPCQESEYTLGLGDHLGLDDLY